MRTLPSLILTSVAIAASTARVARASQDPSPLADTPTEATAATGVAEDPNLDRGFLLPTAMTQPQGSITYNNYELLLHGFTYGITDHLQASVSVLSPIVQGMPFFGSVAIKTRVLDADRFHLALQGSAALVSSEALLLGPGVLGSYCLSADCAALLTASATYQLGLPLGSEVSGENTLIYSGGLVQRLTWHLKLLVEVMSAATARVRGESLDQLDNVPGVLVNYGVRFHAARVAADVGFVRPINTDGSDGYFVLGLPFVNLSYRW
jgi:hypothetical protein